MDSNTSTISFFLLILRFVLMYIVYVTAKDKNRSANAWAAFAFLFPVIALIIILLIKSKPIKR